MSAPFQHLVNDTNDDSDAQPQRLAPSSLWGQKFCGCNMAQRWKCSNFLLVKKLWWTDIYIYFLQYNPFFFYLSWVLEYVPLVCLLSPYFRTTSPWDALHCVSPEESCTTAKCIWLCFFCFTCCRSERSCQWNRIREHREPKRGGWKDAMLRASVVRMHNTLHSKPFSKNMHQIASVVQSSVSFSQSQTLDSNSRRPILSSNASFFAFQFVIKEKQSDG